MKLDFEITRKQQMFIEATADQVLFGGAAGGGKSYIQVIDAHLKALQYPGMKQLILRNSFPELKRSVILYAFEIIARELATYNSSDHVWTYKNGARIEFGYIRNDGDLGQYQSAEYDIIRFDEMTHFTEYQLRYMISRCRGANRFPKQIKGSTNPGGIGHTYVKEHFVDRGAPGTPYPFFDKKTGEQIGTVLFVPSLVTDNLFLMREDPGYVKRLKNLSEDDQKALLDGDWNIWEGQYFTEWKREIHVCEPFAIPKEWRRYVTMDYGLDMLAVLWIALDFSGRAYVYREVHEPNLIISQAAARILDMTPEGETIDCYFAPPDLWNRRQDSGRSVADGFADVCIFLEKVSNDRIAGWYALKEWLHPVKDEFNAWTARLRIFSTCTDLIRSVPALVHDKRHINDVATEPHAYTHAPDALRYFIDGQPMAAREETEKASGDGVPFWEYGR